MDKENVAAILSEIGVLLDLKGENPFKSRAYASAARAMEGLSEPLEKLIAEQRLGEIKGIGEALQKKIEELVTTGKLVYYEELKASVPAGLMAMLAIPGLGPKKVKALHNRLWVETIEQLEAACGAGRVAELDGFGDKTQAKIVEGIQFRRAYASRHLLSAALRVADPILQSLRGHPDVVRCSTAGSVRRFKEVIGDIDFLVSTKKPGAVLDFFTTEPGVVSVSAEIFRLCDYRIDDVAGDEIDLATAVDAAIRDLREILVCWNSDVSRQRAEECELMLRRAFSAFVGSKSETQ